MEEMIGLGASAASGGVFGLLGTVAGRVIGVFEMRERRRDRQIEMEHEARRWKQEHEMQLLQMQAVREETESELALADAAGAWRGLEASYAAAASAGPSYRWVEAVRAMVRPALTPLLWAAVFVVFFRTASDQAHWISAAERDELVTYLANSVVFAATAATLWWFGDRPPRRHTPDGAGFHP